MKLNKIEMTAVIPTGEYANVQAKFEAQLDDGDDPEMAKQMLFDQLENVSAAYAVSDKKVLKRRNVNPHQGEAAKIMEDYFDGGQLMFYHGAHSYVDEEGMVYESGSKYADRFAPEFDKANILPRYAKKYDVEEDDVERLWSDKGDASTTLGTAVHKALEVYGESYLLQKKLGKDPMECIHPLLRPIVAAFYTPERIAQVEKGMLVFEAFVKDKELHRCGQLDLITIIDKKKKILDIEDYKTNVDIFKDNGGSLKVPFKALPNMPVSKYTLQLSFYKDIIEKKGWTVRNINLIHLQADGTWDTVKLSPVNTVRARIKTEMI